MSWTSNSLVSCLELLSDVVIVYFIVLVYHLQVSEEIDDFRRNDVFIVLGNEIELLLFVVVDLLLFVQVALLLREQLSYSN